MKYRSRLKALEKSSSIHQKQWLIIPLSNKEDKNRQNATCEKILNQFLENHLEIRDDRNLSVIYQINYGDGDVPEPYLASWN